EELQSLAADASCSGGWFARRRAARARTVLRQWIGTDDPAAIAEVLRAHEVAKAAAELPPSGGLEVGDRWTSVVAAIREVRRLAARRLALDTHSAARFNRATLPAISALATALRSGRSARRLQLQRLHGDRLTVALPLWIGTLADIEDLLPPVGGLFDLVIMD